MGRFRFTAKPARKKLINRHSPYSVTTNNSNIHFNSLITTKYCAILLITHMYIYKLFFFITLTTTHPEITDRLNNNKNNNTSFIGYIYL